MTRALQAMRKQRFARSRRSSYRPSFDILEQRVLLAADLNFTPLPSPAIVGPTNGANESAPFLIPDGFTQTTLQSHVRDAQLADNLTQNSLNESGPSAGRYLFTGGLNSSGSLSRTDLVTGDTIDLLSISVADGQQDGEVLSDYLSIQHISTLRWTPWGTLLIAEALEGSDPDYVPDPAFPTALNGLVYEVVDPTSASPTIFARPLLGSADFEGLDFDVTGNVYYVDNAPGGGAVLQFVPTSAGDLSDGIVSALFVDGNDVGQGQWVELDSTVQDSVRLALSAIVPPLGFTGYDTPKDVEVATTALGEVLYVAVQGENRVLGIDLDGETGDPAAPFVRVYLDTTLEPDLSAPADLSVDAAGRVYVAEQNLGIPVGQPGNDLWVASDTQDTNADPIEDGVADVVGRFASLSTRGAVIYGTYVNPFNNNDIYVNVSGATSNNDRIIVIHQDTLTPSVTEVVVGNDVVLSIVGSDNSDRITISGGNLLTVKIGTKVWKGLAPTNNIIVYGQGGNDRVTSATGIFYDFTVFGGTGNDYIATGSGDDVISGGAGNDIVLAGSGENVVYGNDGNDSISGGRGNDLLYGDAGNDRLNGFNGDDTVDGGAGNDMVFGGFGDDYLRGGTGDDTVTGYFGDDLILGDAGNDLLNGGSGQDVIIGGRDADRLLGGDGEDMLIGEPTILDNDVASLFVLWQTWIDNSFASDRASIISSLIDPVTSDGAKDLLDGGAGMDLFYIFPGIDVIKYVKPGDEVVEL